MKSVVVKNKDKYQIVSLQSFKKPSHLFAIFLILIILVGILLEVPFLRVSTYFSLIDSVKMTNLCSESYDFKECYGSELGDLIGSENLVDIKERLWLITVIDRKASDCHLPASKIAHKFVLNNPDNWQASFRYLDPNDCDGGYLYGVLEGLSISDHDFDYRTENLEKACQSAVGVMEKTNLNICSQNLGAVILVHEKGDLRASLDKCATLSTSDLQQNCMIGVFEEYFSKNILSDHKIAKKAQDTAEEAKEFKDLCKKLERKESEICFNKLYN